MGSKKTERRKQNRQNKVDSGRSKVKRNSKSKAKRLQALKSLLRKKA
jgi:hypothetical protein